MTSANILPEQALLHRLAINDSGFIFDPVSGRSFTANATGLAVLQQMMQESSLIDIVEGLSKEWELESIQAERDVMEFATELRKAFQG